MKEVIVEETRQGEFHIKDTAGNTLGTRHHVKGVFDFCKANELSLVKLKSHL